jgi:hypothetical protein
MVGNGAWHLYKRSYVTYGPSLDRLFMQSNFGIVTKMGVWLLPAPEVYMPVWVRVWKEPDVVALVDTMRELRLERTLQAGPVIYNTLMYASVFGRRSQFHDGDGPIPDAIIDDMARKVESGRWLLRAGLFGREEIIDLQYARIKAAFELIMFDAVDETVARRADDTAKLMVAKAAEHGYGEFRAHVDFMDEAARPYGFNANAYLRFVEKIKDAVDPDGILSPGKQGTWPPPASGDVLDRPSSRRCARNQTGSGLGSEPSKPGAAASSATSPR